jgi:hypothetical protein
MNRITLAVALTVATFSTGAFAQSSDEQQACMNDAFRVCSATIPDRNKTIACMVQNKPKLSAACQVVMDKYAPSGTTTAYASATPAPAAPTRAAARNVSMKPVTPTAVKPVKTAATTQRTGKPLNILMR